MGLKIGLQLAGKYFMDLSGSEQEEILSQIANLKNDVHYTSYRYYKTKFHKWIILNAFLVPMESSHSIWRDHGKGKA